MDVYVYFFCLILSVRRLAGRIGGAPEALSSYGDDGYSGISASSNSRFHIVQMYFTKGEGMLLMPLMADTYAFSSELFTLSRPTLAKNVWKL